MNSRDRHYLMKQDKICADFYPSNRLQGTTYYFCNIEIMRGGTILNELIAVEHCLASYWTYIAWNIHWNAADCITFWFSVIYYILASSNHVCNLWLNNPLAEQQLLICLSLGNRLLQLVTVPFILCSQIYWTVFSIDEKWLWLYQM